MPGRPIVALLLATATLRCGADATQGRCKALRAAMRQAAQAGLLFYSHGTPTGATRGGDNAEIRHAAHGTIANATRLLALVEDAEGGFEACLPPEDLSASTAANLSRGLLRLLVRQPSNMRARLAGVEPFGEDVIGFFGPGVSWADMIRSAWPVFGLAALIEHELRLPVSQPLAINRLYALDASENCTHEQEIFHEVSNLYFGEGRTVLLVHVREHLRAFVSGDTEDTSGARFLLDVLFGQPVDPARCPAALSVAYAALADALQCHWQRPQSVQTHDMIEAALERAQMLAAKAFGPPLPRDRNDETAAEEPLRMLTSRWPVVQFLARLDPPITSRLSFKEALDSPAALVSWSSREAELGGSNWAATFATEIFGGRSGVELRPDVECADVYVFRSKVPVNFGGVLVFVDGETSPEESRVGELLSAYPASIVVGPRPAGGLSVHFPVPYASTSFASRADHTPELLDSYRAPPTGPRRFTAYLAFKCWPHRERFFAVLSSAAANAGLGEVDVLSRCGGSSQEEDKRRGARYSANYKDDAVKLYSGYRFALVFENRISPRYVTEKIVNALLAGAVPIYWGSPFVFRLFEPSSFIYVNAFETFEAAAQRVVEVATNELLYESFFAKPPLRNTSAAAWHFSWHRQAARAGEGTEGTLRDALATTVLEKVEAAASGIMPAIERRPWDFLDLFARNENGG